jgi:hypothetical protein
MALLTGPWKIKRGATSPPYRVTLRNADKSPVDLSVADHVNFVMCLRGETELPTVDALAATIQEGDAATGTNVGVCEYDWAAGDTDMIGIYDVEFALYDASGNVYARIPNDGYLELQILGNLSAPPPAPTLTAISPTEWPAADTNSFTLTFTGTGFDSRIAAATLTSPGAPQSSPVQLDSQTQLTGQFAGLGMASGAGTACLVDGDGEALTDALPFTWT